MRPMLYVRFSEKKGAMETEKGGGEIPYLLYPPYSPPFLLFPLLQKEGRARAIFQPGSSRIASYFVNPKTSGE